MYKVDGMAEMYHVLSKEILEKGDIVSPRGMETRELITPVIHIENPKSRLAFLPERKFNIVYALVESLMLISKTKKLDYFTEFNPKMASFSDDGMLLHGAYGERIAREIEVVISKLKSDKDSRQAVLSIYNNDLIYNTKDVPCTMNLHFLIRENKLNLIVYMRSNDIIWGTPYDIFMFTMLQEVIANTLGIDVGYYRHVPSSLHVYAQHYEMLEKMADCTEVIMNDNNFDLYGFKTLARDYKELVDLNKYEDDGKLYSNNFVQYRNVILNEKSYRDDVWASRNNVFITSNVPEWTKKFTTRWINDK